jgi:putative ABC transport system permease protein
MKWLELALKNMIRRPTRTALAVLGVAIAVAVLFSLIQFQNNYEQGLRAEVADLGAHIMVVPRGCPYEAATIVLHGGKWPRYMEYSWYEAIRKTKGIAASAPIIMDAIIKRGGQENLIYLGVDDNYPKLRRSWAYQSGGWFDGDDTVILGASAAAKEGVVVGGNITVADGKRIKPTVLRVAGILQRNNTQDDGLYFLPMATHQRLFNLPGKIVVVLVRVADVARVDEVVKALRDAAKQAEASMNVFPLSELLGTLRALLTNTRVFVLAIVAVALLIGTVGVLNTVMMAVYERTAEIGMMKAMGAGAASIFRLIWLETLFTCVVGALVGVAAAMALGRGVVAVLVTRLPHVPRNFALTFSWTTFGVCVLVAALLGLLAGTYPAYRAARVHPIEAIRGGSQ